MESDRRNGVLYRIPENLLPWNSFSGYLDRPERTEPGGGGRKYRINNYYWLTIRDTRRRYFYRKYPSSMFPRFCYITFYLVNETRNPMEIPLVVVRCWLKNFGTKVCVVTARRWGNYGSRWKKLDIWEYWIVETFNRGTNHTYVCF